MKTFPIAKFNGFRGANELVVYEGSGHTGTNNYGLEACVLDGPGVFHQMQQCG